MLRTRSLGYAIGGRALVDDASLDVQPGSLTVVVGPNGAGKTTLVRLLSGELPPTSGDLTLDGRSLRTISAPPWGAPPSARGHSPAALPSRLARELGSSSGARPSR